MKSPDGDRLPAVWERVMENRKTVEIIIPSFKPGKELEELLTRLYRQTRQVDEIRVINTQKEYWDDRLQERFPMLKVTHIRKEEFDHGGTRRKAANESTADFLVFMTQDAIPENENLLAALLSAFEEDNKIGVAYARQLPKPDCQNIERFYREYSYPDVSSVRSEEDTAVWGIRTYFCSVVCAAYRRNYYLDCGGFPEHTIFNEDMICTGRLLQHGYKAAYVSTAQVEHSHNYSCSEQFRRNFDLGVSHSSFPEIFSRFQAEGEGIAMVAKNLRCQLSHGRFGSAVYLIFQSASKYIGYRMGRAYRHLPRRVVLACTANPGFWRKEKKTEL